MDLKNYDISTRYVAHVLSSERITSAESSEEVRDILLEVANTDFRAHVGQNIGVIAPGRKEIGQDQHFRLYSIADVPVETQEGRQQFPLCVRRCNYVDKYSGEEFAGIASNYLCDLQPDDSLTITGPYGQAFELPSDSDATLIMIGAGTGIAPFRAFIKFIYSQKPDYAGRIFLFHGGETGLDLLYRNDAKDDFALYYDRETFEAIDALSNRPGWSQAIDWGSALRSRSEELCRLLCDNKTCVYIAGLQHIMDELDDVLAEVAGSNQRWFHWKADLEAEKRWVELLY